MNNKRGYKMDIDDIEVLINEVQKRRALYDINALGYRDRNRKKMLWEEICAVLSDRWMYYTSQEKSKYVIEIQKRWNSLRDCFRRELHHRQEMLLGGARRKAKYRFFDALQFLLPFTQLVNTESTSSEQEKSPPLRDKSSLRTFPSLRKRSSVQDTTSTQDKTPPSIQDKSPSVRDSSSVRDKSPSLGDKSSSVPNTPTIRDTSPIKGTSSAQDNIPSTQENSLSVRDKSAVPDADDTDNDSETETPRKKMKPSTEKDDTNDELLRLLKERNRLIKTVCMKEKDSDELFLLSLKPFFKDLTLDENMSLRIGMMQSVLRFKLARRSQ